MIEVTKQELKELILAVDKKMETGFAKLLKEIRELGDRLSPDIEQIVEIQTIPQAKISGID